MDVLSHLPWCCWLTTTEAVGILKELSQKTLASLRANNQVVVFPGQAKDAMPVRLVASKDNRFYDAMFSFCNLVRLTMYVSIMIVVTLCQLRIVGGASSAPVGINDASDNRINPATKDIDAIASALADLATEQTADDQIDILNEIKLLLRQ